MKVRIFWRLTILALITMFFAQNAEASGNPISSPGRDTLGNYKLYRMVPVTGDCPLPPIITPVDIKYNCRNATVTVYQATGSITLCDGFTSEDGATFTIQIIPSTYGVPQATNLTGTADADYNWTQATSFDENGNIITDGKQFYDNSGQALQTQTKTFYRAGTSTVYTHVFASQPILDALGRPAATTLAAPIDYADFSYRLNFLQRDGTGTLYNYNNFDLTGSTTTSPDAIWNASSGNPIKGTLAWYYNKSNTWEPYAPETAYPYSRQTWYGDGSGNVKQTATAGDPLRMGTGHELSSYVTPVANELDFYLQVRNRFFATTEVGALSANLLSQAIQTISRDANGTEVEAISDRSGHVLVSARTGTGITVTNSATVAPAGSGNMNIYYFKLLASGTVSISGSTFTLEDMGAESMLTFTSGGTLQPRYYKLVNTGASSLTIGYANSYADMSYNFYDQKGQLIATIAPEGVNSLFTAGINTYSTRASIPFITEYSYDTRGRLVRALSPDRDKTRGGQKFVYRNDGKLRFSQNEVQAISGSYSYSNYDALGRVVEYGQYDGSGISFGYAAMTAILESIDPGGGLVTGTKSGVTQVIYDVKDNNLSTTLPAYTPDEPNLAGQVSASRKYSSIVNNTPSNTDLISATWFNYDEEGKTTWMIIYVAGLGSGAGGLTGTSDPTSYKRTNYSYDVLGNTIRKDFQPGQPDAFSHIYDYDPVNKSLWHVYTSLGGATPILQATYYYYLHGGLKRVELGSGLQGIDYTYTLQGALKAINNSNNVIAQDPGNDGNGNGFQQDAFGEVLDYFTDDYKNNRGLPPAFKAVDASAITTDSYAGNIKAMTWYSAKPVSSSVPGTPLTYVYQYDPQYQFIKSTMGQGLNFNGAKASFTATNNFQEQVGNSGTPAYDRNGNIKFLQRTDGAGTTTDAFSYQYNLGNNQLTSVTNTLTNNPDCSYGYDEAGRVKTEVLADGTQRNLLYDVTKKVSTVNKGTSNTAVVSFVYDETGQRIKKLGYDNSGQLNQVTYYIGDVIYTQSVTGPAVVQEYAIKGADRIGTYLPLLSAYVFELKDHLGNVRALIDMPSGGTAYEIRSSSDYYPFGEAFNEVAPGYRYGYQGQNAEKDPETGWNAFQLRMYDSKIGRWLQYDPAGQFYSPYIGMGNNPVSSIDPDGGSTKDYFKNGKTGEIFYSPTSVGSITDEGGYWVNIGKTYDEFDGIFYTGTWGENGKFQPFKARDEGTISMPHPRFWQRMENGNIFQSLLYGTVNPFFVTAQNLGGKQLQGRTFALNLNGSVTTPKENVLAFAGTGMSFLGGEEAMAGANMAERELPLFPSLSRRMTPDQEALKDLLKEVTLDGRNAISRYEAEAAMQMAEDVAYPGFTRAAADFSPVNNHWFGGPHFNFEGLKFDHIKVIP